MLSNFLISQGFDIFGRAAVQFSAGFAAALAIMLIFGNAFINRMRTWQKKGQPIREDGPKTHAAKAGTPTMGGLLILAAIFTASILFMDIYNPIPWIALASLAAFGAIGFVDDFGKVKRQSSQNKDALLSPKARLALGGIIAIVLTYFIDKNMPAYMTGLSIYFPIFHKLVHFGILYFVFAYFNCWFCECREYHRWTGRYVVQSIVAGPGCPDGCIVQRNAYQFFTGRRVYT